MNSHIHQLQGMLESNSQEDPDYQNKTQTRRPPADVVHRSPLDGQCRSKSQSLVHKIFQIIHLKRSFHRADPHQGQHQPFYQNFGNL